VLSFSATANESPFRILVRQSGMAPFDILIPTPTCFDRSEFRALKVIQFPFSARSAMTARKQPERRDY